MQRRAFSILALALTASVATAGSVLAQDFPTKPIRIVVPWAPGGTTDLSCRKLAQIAEGILGQPIVVENRPGATGTNGIDDVVRSPADGYMLASVTAAPIMIVPVTRDIGYDPLTDLVPIMNYSGSFHGIVVPAESPWQSFEELVAFGKDNQGVATYATSGTYDGSHFSVLYVEDQSGAKFTNVPFTGGATAIAAVLGRHVSFGVLAGWADHVRNGDLRLLGVVDGFRDPTFPDAPTLREMGYDWEYSSIMGLMAPAGTPEDVVQKLETAFIEAAETAEFKGFLASINLPERYMDRAEMGAMLQRSLPFYAEMVEQLGIKQ
jgi:tripartite-type tricarboxylate transporter receptor subunit TctC